MIFRDNTMTVGSTWDAAAQVYTAFQQANKGTRAVKQISGASSEALCL